VMVAVDDSASMVFNHSKQVFLSHWTWFSLKTLHQTVL